MSSVQAFTLSYDSGDIASKIASKDSAVEVNVNVSALNRNVSLRTTSKSVVRATLNDSAKSVLYPNATAHPIKADISCSAFGSWSFNGNTARGYHYIDGTDIFNWSFAAGITSYTSNKSTTGNTNSALLKSTKNSTIQFGLLASGGSGGFVYGSITFYFNRYDFAVSRGSGIASASVSASNGYDGDKITYTCSIVSGATFDGWYNGSTKVSSSTTYTHTVNGSDLTLEARTVSATPSGGAKITVTYNGSEIISEDVTGDVSVTYDNREIAEFSNGAKTLKCAGMVMISDVVINGRTLKCSGKIMDSDVVINIESSDEPITITFSNHVMTITGVRTITQKSFSNGVLTLR